MSWQLYRSIVEDTSVSARLRQYESELPRFAEAWNGLTWLLARKGEELGAIREGTGLIFHLYVQEADPQAGTPRITVLYSCSEHEINLHGVSAE